MANKQSNGGAKQSARGGQEIAATWARLMTLFIDRRDELFVLMHSHGLTPPYGHALSVLANGPTRMRDLADHMACDASYITAIVDKLETSGLAERRPGAADRRVKEIALTPRGGDVAEQLRRTMATPPKAFQRLTNAERDTLAQLLAKVVRDDEISADPLLSPNPKQPGHQA
jgi:DNA-binding MarR family transcriptional regulator